MDISQAQIDHRVIYEIIEPGSRVLDLGCGSGELLQLLAEGKDCKVQGIELDEQAIYQCVENGLSVFHGDIDSGLSEYPDKSFDYVILNQSMQQVKRVDFVITESLRVADKAIIGFPNFTYLAARFMLFFRGKAPITPSLPYHWYDTPNIHFLSIADFRYYCRAKGVQIIKAYYLGKNGSVKFWPNLFALNAIFVISHDKL